MLLLAFSLKDTELSVGGVVGGWPDLAQSSLGGGGRRWRVKIRELEMLGRDPGRWATTDGFINFDSAQSLCAMRSLLLVVVFGFFFGSGRRRGRRPSVVREGSEGFDVIFVFDKVLCEVWLRQMSLYPLCTCLYSYNRMYVFLT
jgi:hypothetical protein